MPQLDWDATIENIRQALPQTQFQNWIKPLTLIRCDDESVVLGVPSRFHEEWLRNHYSTHIASAIHRNCGSELQLEFEVLVADENMEASLSPSEPIPGQRPPLRVLEGGHQSQERPMAMPAAPVIEAPNLPVMGHAFVELDSNKVPYQCALLVVEGTVPLNPLVIQAGVGMGKTHLLSEIGSRIHLQNKRARIRYTNAESFTSEMVQAIKSNTILSFKQKYREQTDVLLFDDIHQLSRRVRTQEELMHIFNEIVGRGGRVVFTTTVSMHRVEEFIDPLKSRLLSGVIAEVKTPTFEEKVQLLARMAEHSRLVVDPIVLRSLADKGQRDVRELLGTLFRVHLQAKLENRSLDDAFLAEEGFAATEPKREAITLDEIVSMVEHNFGVDRAELMSKSRKSLTTWARQVAMYLARHHTLLPLEEIGKQFGRDHATVIHAFQKVTETMETQPTRRYEVEFLKQKLQNRGPKQPDFLNPL